MSILCIFTLIRGSYWVCVCGIEGNLTLKSKALASSEGNQTPISELKLYLAVKGAFWAARKHQLRVMGDKNQTL